MSTCVRRAAREDVPAIAECGRMDSAFRVSDHIRFYEVDELYEWVARPEDNLLLVAEEDGDLNGFVFCKIMSYHWALLDTLYVLPSKRNGCSSRMLLASTIDILASLQVQYVSTMASHANQPLGRWLRMHGFIRRDNYDWYDAFLAPALDGPHVFLAPNPVS